MRHAAAAAFAIATLLAAPAAARAGDGTALLGLVPDTADFVMAIDLADARDSAVFLELFGKAMDAEPGLRDALASAGFSFERDVDTIVCGFEDGQQMAGCVVEGRLPKDILAKLSGGGATRTYKGVKYVVDGAYEAAVVKKRLLMARTGGIKAVIDLATAKKGKARKSVALSPDAAALRALIADTDTRHDLWAVVARPVSQAGIDVTGWSIAATPSQGVALQARAHLADAAAATQAAAFLNQGLAQVEAQVRSVGLGQTLDSLVIASDGALLDISLTLPEAELQTLISLLAMF